MNPSEVYRQEQILNSISEVLGPPPAAPQTFIKVIESMTTVVMDVQDFPATIRIWRSEREVKSDYNNQDLVDICNNHKGQPKTTLADLARILSTMPRVSAVEAKDHNGCGVVIYTEWP